MSEGENYWVLILCQRTILRPWGTIGAYPKGKKDSA